MKYAVFASGFGTNLQEIIKEQKKGTINAELTLVFSNKRKANALKIAKEAGIPTLFLNPKDYTNPQSFERDLVIYLKEAGIDFIVLAGYMKMLTPWFVKQYPNQIINVHPSLLPAFKGARGIKDTFTYGTKIGGITIHFVDDKMDAGPIIFQESFKIHHRDTLEDVEEKVHALEYKHYAKVIALYCDGRLKVVGRKVKVLEKARDK